MNIKDIEKIADKAELEFGMYKRMLTRGQKGEQVMKYVASGRPTLFGEKLIHFANEIERGGKVNINDIEEIVLENGSCYRIREKSKLTRVNNDDGTIGFKYVSNGKLTQLGKSLIDFTNEIEKFCKSQEKSKEK